MRISDLLRKVADLVDKSEAVTEPEPTELEPVATDNTDNTDTATMISPLQQKHELLKKVSDVSNNTEKFDDPNSDDGSCEQAPDELDQIKDLAGLTGCQEEDPAKIALHFMSDDHESD